MIYSPINDKFIMSNDLFWVYSNVYQNKTNLDVIRDKYWINYS